MGDTKRNPKRASLWLILFSIGTLGCATRDSASVQSKAPRSETQQQQPASPIFRDGGVGSNSMMMRSVQPQEPPQAAPPAQQVETPKTATIVLSVTGFRNLRGHVIAHVYRSKKGFPADATVSCARSAGEIIDGTALVEFPDMVHGTYAAWVCHDENRNNKVDHNILGLPREGVGVTGKRPSGMPSFEDAKFELNASPCLQPVTLHYLFKGRK